MYTQTQAARDRFPCCNERGQRTSLTIYRAPVSWQARSAQEGLGRDQEPWPFADLTLVLAGLLHFTVFLPLFLGVAYQAIRSS